jgi:drug/metabolite transporter (DMT)-like permease
MPSYQLGRVVLWMTGTLVSFCIMAVSVRALTGAFSIFEILTIRSAVGLVVLGVIVLLQPGLAPQLRPRRLGMHLTRNLIHFVSQYAWAVSLTLLPLATVVALEFTMPAWTTLLAALLLGERLTVSRVGAIALGIVGVLVIVQPGTATFQPAMLLILAAAFGYAASNIATKKLTSSETPFAVVFWMSAMQLPMGLAGSDLASLLNFDTHLILPMLGIGVTGLSAHYCLTHAFRVADASVVIPLDFLRIPSLALIGWVLYGERIDTAVFIGAGIIVVGVLWNLRAESRRH